MRFLGAAIVGILGCATHLQAEERPLLEFDKYHTLNEISTYLKAVTTRHSKLSRWVEIGRSRGGLPIFAVEIHNPDTGPIHEKPAFYVDGNIHGGEVLAGEAALHFIDHLLGSYGREGRITCSAPTVGRGVSPSLWTITRFSSCPSSIPTGGRFPSTVHLAKITVGTSGPPTSMATDWWTKTRPTISIATVAFCVCGLPIRKGSGRYRPTTTV